jgi:hypothetical protein
MQALNIPPRFPAVDIKDNRGRAVRKTKRNTYLLGQTGYAMGHVERPLAEVFSVMPRCAPLRLPQGEASGGPFSRPLPVCTWRTPKQVAFALGRKSLPFLYMVSVTDALSLYPGTDFAGSKVGNLFVSSRIRTSARHWPKRFLFGYNQSSSRP